MNLQQQLLVSLKLHLHQMGQDVAHVRMLHVRPKANLANVLSLALASSVRVYVRAQKLGKKLATFLRNSSPVGNSVSQETLEPDLCILLMIVTHLP